MTKTISPPSCWDSGLCLAVSWVCCCEGQNVPLTTAELHGRESGRVFVFPMVKSPPMSLEPGCWVLGTLKTLGSFWGVADKT